MRRTAFPITAGGIIITGFLFVVISVSANSFEHSHRDAYLRSSWKDVTPGSISGPVRAVRYRERGRQLWGLSLITEDRHLRVFDSEGQIVREVRTGMRSAVAMIQERSGRLVLADQNGALRRVSLETGTFTGIAAIDTPMRSFWQDSDGNFYLIGIDNAIAHISATGNLLWRRILPSIIKSVGTTEGSLYLATLDGRLFRFDNTGYGRTVYQTDHPLDTLEVYPRGRKDFLVGIGADGIATAIEIEPSSREPASSRSSGGRRLWTTSLGSTGIIIGIDNGNNTWVISDPDHLTILNEKGVRITELKIPGACVECVALDSRRERMYVLGEGNRVLTVLKDGTVNAAFQFFERPESFTYVPETDELVVRYGDWTVEVYRGSVPSQRGITRIPQHHGVEAITRPSAIMAFASTILDGTSVSDRIRLLDLLRTRLEASDLYGEVSNVRSIAVRLANELYSSVRTSHSQPLHDYPEVRRQAISFLGLILDIPSREALTYAVVQDPRAVNASRAMSALGRYGSDDFAALERGYERFHIATDDEREVLAEGILAFLEGIAGVGGHYLPEDRLRLRRYAITLSGTRVSEPLRRRAAHLARRFE